MPKVVKRDPEALVNEAWIMIDEAISSGLITLDDGSVFKLEGDAMISLVKWLATLKRPKAKVVTAPEGFNLQESDSDEEN